MRDLPAAVIRGRFVVTTSRVLEPGEVVVEAGRIVAVRESRADAPAFIVCPGFVDLQVNGFDDVDVWGAAPEGWERLARRLAEHGTTTWLPTLVSSHLDAYPAAIERVAQAMGPGAGTRVAGARVAGAHLEGPFLGTRVGAHDPARVRAIDHAWLDALGPPVRVLTLAPELDGATTAIAGLAARGIVVALGHSDATAEQVSAAIDAGATLVTHLYNAMAPVSARAPGLAGVALTDDRVVAGLIADGVHVALPLVALTFRAKQPSGIALVSDAVAWSSDAFGGLPLEPSGAVVRRPDGTIAGSRSTLAQAVATCVRVGVPLADAVRAAATTPADLLGLADRGRLEPGARADIVVLDERFRPVDTWIDGCHISFPAGGQPS